MLSFLNFTAKLHNEYAFSIISSLFVYELVLIEQLTKPGNCRMVKYFTVLEQYH